MICAAQSTDKSCSCGVECSMVWTVQGLMLIIIYMEDHPVIFVYTLLVTLIAVDIATGSLHPVFVQPRKRNISSITIFLICSILYDPQLHYLVNI